MSNPWVNVKVNGKRNLNRIPLAKRDAIRARKLAEIEIRRESAGK